MSHLWQDCFDPIVATSGRDLIPIMVCGRNIYGQEFGGMYCVVLIAGLLRIFGREVAELPLVATSRENQGKGYFQALFSCIESLLYSLNVENLVLPAAEEAESIWTKKLASASILTDINMSEQLLKYPRNLQLTIFKGTSMSVVSVGLLRIFGRKVTELPLVATSGENQGKGYFQALFSCIESLLYSLNVENLVLPVAEEAESIWTKKLGFRKMSDERFCMPRKEAHNIYAMAEPQWV
ncbi:hypothetical protein TEA_002555 [Camellia sinensis var. sinensis]|uniref:Increased DNA methylation 1 C-terminal domain-containing protein n=1 Tax=Camellia sinensis var. sinensis TaxID=542762 RepID=A0A4S4DGU6_CAMSN|nr:hypothetical protein TEA_002555 [Camellia sinensis var. sinensis]